MGLSIINIWMIPLLVLGVSGGLFFLTVLSIEILNNTLKWVSGLKELRTKLQALVMW